MPTKQIKKPRAAARPLAPYRAKRDFEVTEEPRGARKPKTPTSSELPFVVQKHAATRRHYDFRLGWGGVLKSWAVTRGPSYYPGDKRLAVQVEEHPMEYKDFEGTIPKGQYGGGTVMVWDRGTWEPHDDVDRGLEEGHLKFALHGTRLKGDWALVRMKSRPGDRKSNWLLIKEHDRFERPSSSKPITETAAVSAVTKRTLDEIAKSANKVNGSAGEQSAAETEVNRRPAPPAKLKAILERAPREKPPAFIAPQLAQTASQPPEGDDWVHELKFDGYRIQIHIHTGKTSRESKATLLTRNHFDWSSRMPQIAASAARLPLTTAILDGEVVVLNDKGVADFAELQATFQEGKKKPLTYIAFDLLHLDGHNLRGLPFLDRKALLADLLQRNGDSVLHFSEHLEAHGKETFAAVCRLGAEGIVSKLASAKYTSGRGSTWRKAKCHQEQELVIGGFTPVAKSGQGIGALLLGYYHGGELRYAGRTGTGFSQATQKLLRPRLEKLIQKKPPFTDPPRGSLPNVRWVRPELVAQVSFSNWTRDNLVRQAAFKGLREDKPTKDVIREAAAAPVSCCLACSIVVNVPRLRRLPVEASFFLEYRRYCPDLSFRIIPAIDASVLLLVAGVAAHFRGRRTRGLQTPWRKRTAERKHAFTTFPIYLAETPSHSVGRTSARQMRPTPQRRILALGRFLRTTLPLGSLFSASAFTLDRAFVPPPLAMQVAQNKGRNAKRGFPVMRNPASAITLRCNRLNLKNWA